jgi:hypothetical protein
MPRLVLPRPPSFRTETTFAREAIQAGKRPETTAAARVASTETARTDASMSNRIQAGGGLSSPRMVVDRASTQSEASPTPRTAPSPARSRLSVSICAIRRSRLAPSEERTASSRARSVARANCMFITLTQAITSTPTQKASMVRSVPERGRGVKVLISGSTWPAENCLLVSG